jgi:gliding motility-associated-like protein
MCFRKLILVLLVVFACDKLSAANFVVTSNADSGPGTLRQALSDAAVNGTATTDNITFNLPGAGQPAITITLLSQLPDVTANVIIDGTTQPGLALGLSNAKVIITTNTPAAGFNGLSISPLVGVNDDVEIYGLYIEGFSPNQGGLGSGIITGANCKLIVGAPGKGNVISGNAFAFTGYFQNSVIQSNFIGVYPDGLTVFANATVFYSAQDYNNLLIGGPVAQDGNVILCGPNAGLNFGGGSSTASKTITIQNNFFNTDYTGTKSIAIANNSCILVSDPNSILLAVGNVFSAAEIAILGINKPAFIITGNFFGTDKTQTFPLGSGSWAIENNDVISTIGGTTPAAQNVFTNYQNPINAYNGSFTNVIQNSFYCNSTVQLNDPTGGQNFILITTLTNTTVGGDAPAGASVQLYFTQTKCGSCNPNTWFATVTADNTGKWSYTGTITQNVLASSTLFNNTVGFLIDSLSASEATITNFDCHHAGAITLNENRTSNFQFAWTDSKGNSVGNTQNVSNLQPGTYTLLLSENGGCPSASGSFTVIDLTPKVFPQTAQLDCSTPTASFTTYPSTGPNITVANYYWEDASGTLIGTHQSINNLTAGNYYLYITDSNGCNSAKALIQVLASPTAPTINTGAATETDATCGLSNGSVTGITLTNGANTSYGWNTVNNQEFSAGQLNLTNAPAGQYYFFDYYDFNCPPVKSQVFTINSAGVITIDDSGVTTTSSTCSNSNGAIAGITTTGASAYQWYNSQNRIVGNSLDLTGVPTGNYYLVASNGTCTQQSQVYTVGNIPAISNYQSTYTETDATCNLANGSLAVEFSDDPDGSPTSYRWADATGKTLIVDDDLTGAAAGTYQLFVTDANGCESLYKTYIINATELIQIDIGSVQITPDQCLTGTGSIQNTVISGGVPPYSYAWLNAANQNVGSSQGLSNVTAGTYTLQVKDATGCGLATQAFTIPNQTEFVAEPELDNLQICSPGQAMLLVNNPQPGYGYRLYGSPAGTDTLAQSATGVFTISVSASSTYYVTQYSGSCESARAVANITIGLSGLSIPNTFTPNNDGINDYWNIKGIENYPTVMVQIFNRYGQKVFESRGYNQPFDGLSNGAQLPTGVYYYIINLNANCSLVSGSLTLIR